MRENRIATERDGMPNWRGRRAPGSPPTAKATCRNHSRKRSVRRACGLTIAGSRSVQRRRGQSGVSQKKRRDHSSRRVGMPAQGRSATIRRSRVWMRADRLPHCGQHAVSLQVRREVQRATCGVGAQREQVQPARIQHEGLSRHTGPPNQSTMPHSLRFLLHQHLGRPNSNPASIRAHGELALTSRFARRIEIEDQIPLARPIPQAPNRFLRPAPHIRGGGKHCP